MKINLTPTELIDQLRAWFHPKDRVLTLSDEQWIKSQRVAWETTVSKGQALPGLVGFWPMSSVQRSTGNVYDLSGQGRTLTYNGNPVFSIYNDFIPYAELDGTGDYFSRNDETDLDILGTEAIYAAAVRGLTAAGWWWISSIDGTARGLITKNDLASNRSYHLVASVTSYQFGVDSVGDGTGTITVSTTAAPTTGVWAFVAGRFRPSTELAIFVNRTKTTNTTSIPASIFNSNTALEVGRYGLNASRVLPGRASLCFLCANALSDTLINAYYQQTRSLFGV